MKTAERFGRSTLPFPESGFFPGENTDRELPKRVLTPPPLPVNSKRGRLPPPPRPAPPSPPSHSATTQVPIELRAGKQFLGQYVVERVVGSMGACVQVKVRHARLGRRFLLKYLTPQASSEPHAVEQFMHSARVAMRLRSEHAAHIVDAGRLACGVPFLITEAFQGSELREILRMRAAFGRVEAVDFVLQAAHAVAEAHRHGIVHGSLSPSTLFVTPGADGLPGIKVLELGSSASLRGNPLAIRLRNWAQGTAMFMESTRLWDTLAYSAPEQVRGSADLTQAVDIWALGAILCELLVGSPPFHGASTTSLVAAIVADAPPAFGRGLPRELEAVVRRCLSKSPDERFRSVFDLAEALRAFASPEAQLTVNRIARLQIYNPEQDVWSSASSGPGLVRATPAPYPSAAQRVVSRRSVALRWTGSLLLAALGASGGVFAGTFVARALASRDANPAAVSPPVDLHAPSSPPATPVAAAPRPPTNQ